MKTIRRALAGLLLLTVVGCEEAPQTLSMAVEGGNAERGRAAIRRHGCGACHEIPGIAPSGSVVGPPLTAMRRTSYIAGVVPNRPQHLVRWIMDPTSVDPRTAMPDLGVSESEARDISAYLYDTTR